MLRSTAQSLGRGFNTKQGAWAYVFHRNALAMHRRVVPNPRGFVARSPVSPGTGQARRAQIEAKLAPLPAAKTKEKKLSVGFSLRMTKLEDKLESLSKQAQSEANMSQAQLFGMKSTLETIKFATIFTSVFVWLLAFVDVPQLRNEARERAVFAYLLKRERGDDAEYFTG
jgi:hypothetical protein